MGEAYCADRRTLVRAFSNMVRFKCCRLTVSAREKQSVRSRCLAEDPEHCRLRPTLLHVSDISTRNHLQAFYGAQTSLEGRLLTGSLADDNSNDKRAIVEACAQPRSSTAFALTTREPTYQPRTDPQRRCPRQRPTANDFHRSLSGGTFRRERRARRAPDLLGESAEMAKNDCVPRLRRVYVQWTKLEPSRVGRLMSCFELAPENMPSTICRPRICLGGLGRGIYLSLEPREFSQP